MDVVEDHGGYHVLHNLGVDRIGIGDLTERMGAGPVIPGLEKYLEHEATATGRLGESVGPRGLHIRCQPHRIRLEEVVDHVWEVKKRFGIPAERIREYLDIQGVRLGRNPELEEAIRETNS